MVDGSEVLYLPIAAEGQGKEMSLHKKAFQEETELCTVASVALAIDSRGVGIFDIVLLRGE